MKILILRLFKSADENSYEKLSRVFKKSVSKTLNTKPWSKHCLYFSEKLNN